MDVPTRLAGTAKRILLGPPLATERLEHERLGKPTALAVFASDNLSSVAYATEEILRVLVPTVGAAAFGLVLPITIAVVAVEAILVFSYRQTIKAYPSAGGAYVVTRDNFGLLPAQIAGVALLVDYVLTVAVSVAAGVQALSSVADVVHRHRVELSLAFIALLTYGNLLGVRESGRIFGLPTYLFLASLCLTIVVGIARDLMGDLHPLPAHAPGLLPLGAAPVGVFLVLRAFASGGAAVTGVEAISNGVPAFRKPEWRNAQITLTWMGAILGSAFLGVSYLAHRLRVVPVADESRSVLSQIGEAVYRGMPLGRAAYLLLQAATMMILVLAANTSFADFPRLASFHAGDSFLPRRFTKRGHRLVFSNGIIGLAVAASLVTVAFGASVTRMIPLYALGVFTSFTLSQAGMARRHLKLREPGWRFGLAINGLGAVATFVVDVVIAIVKFAQGAWIVIVAVPILVGILVRVNRTYELEDDELRKGLAPPSGPPAPLAAVVLVEDMDAKTLHALQYARSLRPRELHALHLGDGRGDDLRARWAGIVPQVPLEELPSGPGDQLEAVARYAARLAASGNRVVIVQPAPARMGTLQRLRRGRTGARLATLVADLPGVSVAVVRDHGGPGHPREPGGGVRVIPRPFHDVILLVGDLDRSVIEALAFARAIQADRIVALHVAVDRAHAHRLLERWAEVVREVDVPLSIQDCPDRVIGREVRRFVMELLEPDREITVVLPRRRWPELFQRLLHDRTSREIAAALRDLPHVDLVVIPYTVRTTRARRAPAPLDPAPSAPASA